MLVVLISPLAVTSTSNWNSWLIVSWATIRIAVSGDSAVLVIDSNDSLSFWAMCRATFGVWRCGLVRHDSEPPQDRQALIDGGVDHVAHGVMLFRNDIRAQRLDPGVGIVLALTAEQAGGDELQ